ncbi:MAG: amino acid adenylation domain-containing protein, partial [Melioribacteraceae bacterium]|nr:amino acid adenylation domain-containing protein [Melioribacteraceae bacterium]
MPELKIQYSDYAKWQNDRLSGDNLFRQMNYWKNELNEIPEKIDLPIDKPRPSVQTFNGRHIDFQVDELLSSEFSDYAKKVNLTPFMLSLAAFNLLLYKYSNQDTVVVGTPIANRNRHEIENLIGFFVNTLAIRTDFSGDDKIFDVLKQIREKTIQAYLYQDLPFEKLVDEIKPDRDMSLSPIFQVAFVFQNTSSEKLKLPGLTFEPYSYDTKISKYDITLYLEYRNGSLCGTFEYNSDLFEKATIEKMKDHYINILNISIKDPKLPLSRLSLLTESELYSIRNSTHHGSISDTAIQTVDQEFYRKVEECSNNVALTFSEYDNGTFFTEELTYDLLNKKTNQVANYLKVHGLENEDLVAILLPRSFDLIISILAVMKAGGAFVPIDPNYPEDRIDFMLKDSNAKFIITHEEIQLHDVNPNSKVVELNREIDLIDSENDTNPNLEIYSNNLAYAIYTSGSTGQPKGTLLTHKGLINLANVQGKEFGITNKKRILQFSSLSFDAFVWETVMALLNGASLNLVSQEIITSQDSFIKLIEALAITTVTLPPSYLSIIPKDVAQDLESLETIIVAGEKCTKELVDRWAGDRQFVNAYGPTETTVCASMFHCKKDHPNNPPIGKPIEGFNLYVLDKYLNPLPQGVPGELYIAGIGLARGYNDLPDLTAKNFLPNPFSANPGSLMYKSGDLVKQLHSGDIEFLGRIDNQVKFRGFRIELGEIESVLLEYQSINDALVMLRDDLNSPKQLVAYIIPKDKMQINLSDLRIFIRKMLPDYMIPATFIELNKFPLTPSKKIDVKALPVPKLENFGYLKEYVEPRNETEKIISEIGKELLGIEKM